MSEEDQYQHAMSTYKAGVANKDMPQTAGVDLNTWRLGKVHAGGKKWPLTQDKKEALVKQIDAEQGQA